MTSDRPDEGSQSKCGELERINVEQGIEVEPHDCFDHAVPCTTNGPLGHGWECGKCGRFLQAG